MTVVLLYAAGAGACTGDCNGNDAVSVNEAVRGVAIALGQAALVDCPVFDTDNDARVMVSELITAVRNALYGCPPSPTASAASTVTATAIPTPTHTATALDSPAQTPSASHSATPSHSAAPTPSATASESATATPTATGPPPSASATPTATANQPPLFPAVSIYRGYAGFPIQVPIAASDPEGGMVTCSAEQLPAGAMLDAPSGLFSWMPGDDQLGPYYVPLSCSDDASPPLSTSGSLILRISEADDCVVPSCDPVSGCTASLVPISENCCVSGPSARNAEPIAGCPEGRSLFVGQSVSTFGRLANCNSLKVVNFEQSGAEVRLHVEARCLNTSDRVQLRARMVSNSPHHPVLFDVESRRFFLSEPGVNGFARQRSLRFQVNGPGPFFDLQDVEATLSLTMTDIDGTSVSHDLRVRLTFAPVADLPDLDPAP